MTTALYVEIDGTLVSEEARHWEGADGLVLGACGMGRAAARALSAPVMALRVAKEGAVPDEWREAGIAFIADRGLEDAARLRDAEPSLDWVPRLEVYRPETRFRLAGDDLYSGGFRCYIPDTAALTGYCVGDAGQSLYESLARAAELGFATLWLHARDAQAKGRGLDLTLLERARRGYRGWLWLSGGASEERHLQALAAEGGAAVAVVSAAAVRACGCARLRAALAPRVAEGAGA